MNAIILRKVRISIYLPLLIACIVSCEQASIEVVSNESEHYREPNPYEHFYAKVALAAESPDPCYRISSSAINTGGRAWKGFQVSRARSDCFAGVAKLTNNSALCQEVTAVTVSALPLCFEWAHYKELGADRCAVAGSVPIGQSLDGSGHTPEHCVQQIADDTYPVFWSLLGGYLPIMSELGYTSADIVSACEAKISQTPVEAIEWASSRYQECKEYSAPADCRQTYNANIIAAYFRKVDPVSFREPYGFCPAFFDVDETTNTPRERATPLEFDAVDFFAHVAQSGEILMRLDRLPDLSKIDDANHLRRLDISLASDSIWRKPRNIQSEAYWALRTATEHLDHVSQETRLELLDAEDPALRYAALDKHKMGGYLTAAWEDIPWEILQELYDDPDKTVRWKARQVLTAANDQRYADILESPATLSVMLEDIMADKDDRFRKRLASDSRTSAHVLLRLSSYSDFRIRLAVGSNDGAPADAIQMLARDASPSIRVAAARHRAAPVELLRRLSFDQNRHVRHAVVMSRRSDEEILIRLSDDGDEMVSKEAMRVLRYLRRPKNTGVTFGLETRERS